MKKILLLVMFAVLALPCVVLSACGEDNIGATAKEAVKCHYASANCDGICDKCSEKMYDGDMTFTLSDNQKYYTVSGSNLEGDVVLPAYFKDTGETEYLPVLKADSLNGEDLTSIAYHKNFEEVKVGNAPKLKKITVDSENPNLKVSDGVLFSKNGKTLIWYPALCEKESYTVPADCKEIDSRAFYQVTKLKRLTVPQTVEEVASSFIFESKIDSVEILAPLNDITFYGSEFREIKIENIQKFPQFYDMQSLEKAYVKGSYEKIESGSFYNCVNLEKTELNDSYESIESSAFYNCIALKKFTVPTSVTSIGNSAFSGAGLTEFTIPDTVKKIELLAFSNCVGLTEIVIPSTVEELSELAFTGCVNIKNYVSYTKTILSLYDFQKLERIEIHNADTINSFFLTNRELPVKVYIDGVKTINALAFERLAPGSEIFVKKSIKPAEWDQTWCDTSVIVHWNSSF